LTRCVITKARLKDSRSTSEELKQVFCEMEYHFTSTIISITNYLGSHEPPLRIRKTTSSAEEK
jgi:hypothetical protein